MPQDQQDSSRDEIVEQLKALGYVDPGAGSSMWQMMLGGFFRFTGGLRKLFGGKDDED